jgi:hypothetical protein
MLRDMKKKKILYRYIYSFLVLFSNSNVVKSILGLLHVIKRQYGKLVILPQIYLIAQGNLHSGFRNPDSYLLIYISINFKN